MGEAYIKSGGGAGYYKVQIIKDAGRSINRLKEIAQAIINIDTVIANCQAQLPDLEQACVNMMIAKETTEAAFIAGTATAEDLRKAQVNYLTAVNNKTEKIREINTLKLRKVSLQKEKVFLENAMLPEEKLIWCADYTESLPVNSIVGTIEIDEDDYHINIAPKGSLTDGKLQPVAVSTPSAVFYNMALMPAVQRWKPTYRAGRIVSVDYKKGVCTVRLDNPNYSRASRLINNHQDIAINQYTNAETKETVLVNIGIEYMNHNYEVFAINDHVIVNIAGRNWNSNPQMKVIGFYTNPKRPVDIMQIQLTDTVANDEFYDLCSECMGYYQAMADWYQYHIDNYSPAYIAIVEGLLGKKMYQVFMWVARYWTEEEVNALADPEREFMGIDVYGDGQRNFYNVIGSELVAYYESLVTSMSILRTAGQYIKDHVAIHAYGHSSWSLSTSGWLEETVVNIETGKVVGELTKLKNPAGVSDYSRKRNLAIESETQWNKYAGALHWGEFIDDSIRSEAHGFESGNIITIYATPESGHPEYWPPEVTAGANYMVSVIDADSFRLKDTNGNVIVMHPSGSECYLAFKLKDTVPIITVQFNVVYYYTIATFSFKTIGLLDNTGEFYMLIYDPQFDSSIIELSVDNKIILYGWETPPEGQDPVKQVLFEYPNSLFYGCVHWNVKDVGFASEKTLNFSITITGRYPQIPTVHGGTPYESVSGSNNDCYGVGITVIPNSFFDMITRSSSFEPNGFFWFASRYYDHPITTGIDNHEVIHDYTEEMTPEQKAALDATKLEIVRQINDYVNNTYAYESDIDDEWEFLGSGNNAGDCEDFALTKINMLLNLGFPIKDFKLQGGYQNEIDSPFEHRIIGHLWVLYKDLYAMDNSGDLKDPADLLLIYPKEIKQISGCTWQTSGVETTFDTTKAWPFVNFEADSFTGKLIIRKFMP